MNKILAAGKLPANILKKLIAELPKIEHQGRKIIIPPGVGLDAAGLKIGKKLVAVTTDPITFTADEIGTYSVAININDVACLGCKPRWFTATLLLPVGTTQEELTKIWHNLSKELAHYKIQAIGGHIEVTKAVNIPLIIGQMIGEALKTKLLDVRNSQPNDKILLWRPIAIEGTAILAKELQQKLAPHFTSNQLHKMQNLIHKPGICIWPFAKKLVSISGLVALHDTTEGGIATALHDIADASNCGLKINYDAIPIMPETQKLAKLLNFDPLGLLASGSLLIVCKANAVTTIIAKAKSRETKKDNTIINEIGELVHDKSTRVLYKSGNGLKAKEFPLLRYDTDEIIRVMQ